MIPVHYGNGIHVPGCDIWFDSLRCRDLGVVTHAHSDHAAWHHETITTPPTAALMRARRGYRNKVVHETAFHQAHLRKDARITLLPAGHVLGSAQVLLEVEKGSILYTGDFKLRHGLSAEAAMPVPADILIMECTFGRPRYRFPERGQLETEIVAFCRTALEDNCVPVLMAYSIGKAQELLAILKDTGLSAVLHSAVFRMTKVYETFSVSFGPYEEYNGANHAGRVVIFPPNVRDQLAHIPRMRTAIASGWAMDKGAIYRYRCEAAFPLSDHADYDELIEYVRLINPRQVLLVHGFVEDFARDLRRMGIEALAMNGVNQLEFRF